LQHPQITWLELLPLYLKELNTAATYKDWQIRQADQAVRLYFSIMFFRFVFTIKILAISKMLS